MHIVQITDDFPPRIGGMAAHTWELSRAIVKKGHEVTVLTKVKLNLKAEKPRFMLENVEEKDGVRIVNLGFNLVMRRYYYYHLRQRMRKHLHKLKKRAENIVLHLHEFTPPKIRMITDLPIVWTNHSSLFLSHFEDATHRDKLKSIVNSCDWITAPSRELFEKTIKLGYPAKRATYITNGVDVDRFNTNGRKDTRCLRLANEDLVFSKDCCVVICARRFVYKNGLHVYLTALESMKTDILSRCTFLFVGNQPREDGTYGKEVEQRIRKLSRKTDCRLLGPVPNDKMPDLYRITDISVLPSLVEATSITGLESMASGIPIAGTNVGGIPEIVEDKVTGMLSQQNDAKGLAKNLETLICRPSIRKQLGANARMLAESKFAWSIIAKQFLKVYESAQSSRIAKM